MYKHYETETVSSDELDEWIATAEERERSSGSHASIQVTDEIQGDDDDGEVDSVLYYRLEWLCGSDDDGGWSPNPSGEDVLAARDELGLKLAIVYSAEGRDEKVVVIDDDAESDAMAWTIMSYVPSWVVDRYRDLITVYPDAELVPIYG
jgi:hypothetical protein